MGEVAIITPSTQVRHHNKEAALPPPVVNGQVVDAQPPVEAEQEQNEEGTESTHQFASVAHGIG